MTNTFLNPAIVGKNFGALLGTILIIISVIMYITGMAAEGEKWPMFLYYFIFPVVVVLGILFYKTRNNNSLTLTEALKIGVLIGVISGILYLAYNLIFNFIIEPDFSEQMLEVARNQMTEAGTLTAEEKEMSLDWVKWMSNPFLGGAIWIAMSAFFGLIYSLITGLIFRNNR